MGLPGCTESNTICFLFGLFLHRQTPRETPISLKRGCSSEILKRTPKRYQFLHKTFTGKYTTRKIHTKLHPGLERPIFHIITGEDIDHFTDIKFVLNCSSIRWCMIESSSGLPRKPSAIFGNFRKMFGNVLAFGIILENRRKSSENRRKRRHQYVNVIKSRSLLPGASIFHTDPLSQRFPVSFYF